MPAMHFTVALPTGVTLPMDTEHPVLALSPDGSRLVFVGEERGKRRLYMRDLAAPQSRPIAGTEGAAAPFFSPNDAWIGFFEGNTLKKVSADGGVPVAVHTVHGIGVNRGATWDAESTVVIARSVNSGLQRLSVAGDRRRPINQSTLITRGTEPYAWPEAIPGRRQVLFANNIGGHPDNARVALLSLESGDIKTLVNGGTSPRYSPTGHVLFARTGSLFAVPFDGRRGQPAGAERRLLDGVITESWGASHFAVAANGTLAYVAGDPISREHELVWVDRRGVTETLLDVGRSFFDVRLSPDGGRLAFSSPDGANYDIWVLDLARRGALSRLTSHPGEDLHPVWSPDGRRLAFASEIGEDEGELGPALAWITGPSDRPERLLRTPGAGHLEFPSSWSPDGRWLAFKAERPGALEEILLLPTSGPRKPVALFNASGNREAATFSRDGHWVAYVSDLSGRDEVYVLPFPGGEESVRISTAGGVEPVWARSGRELFYREDDKMMVVTTRGGSWTSPSTPEVLFEGRFEKTRWGAGTANYDVSPDGQRFVMVRRKNPVAPVLIHVILNWPEALRVPSPGAVR
jgi:Tol biopolymer transport system component